MSGATAAWAGRAKVHAALRLVYRASGARALRLAARRTAGARLRHRQLAAARERLARGEPVLSAAGHPIFLDPSDGRALEVARRGGALDPSLTRLWSRLAAELQPDLVVDVGANYGEVLLGADGPPGAAVVAVEPNPRVASFLARSLDACGYPVRLVEAAAGDHDGEVRLHADPSWSGTASTVLHGAAHTEALTVPLVRLDGIVGRGHRRALVKIDVEGAEPAVLDGLGGVLAEVDAARVVLEVSRLRPDDIDAIAARHRLSSCTTTPPAAWHPSC
jgi:FkbM family methyltransferase